MIAAVAQSAVKYVAMFHFNPNKVVFFFIFYQYIMEVQPQ